MRNLLFGENCINSKADKGIIQLANKVGCSRKTHYKVYFIAICRVLLPMWIGASLKARTISIIFMNSYIMPYINNCSTKLILELFDFVGLNSTASLLPNLVNVSMMFIIVIY